MNILSRLCPLLLLAGLAAWPATAAAAAPPSASATTVQSITSTGVQLTALVSPGDDEKPWQWFDENPRWWFEYGQTTDYGAKTVTRPYTGSSVSANLTGLAPGTTYHVRAISRNDREMAKGPDATFKTLTVSIAPPALGPSPGTTSGAGQQPGVPPVAGALDTTAPEPALGSTVVVGEVSGAIRVRVPGASSAVPLSAAAGVPVGSVVDARDGVVELSSVVEGEIQSGRFWGAVFQVRQSRSGDGMTHLVLRGGRPEACGRRAGAARAAAVAGKRRQRKGLWGKDKGGRFRTHGRNSVATVRGTTWLVEERCEGTLTRVTKGAVVVRDVRRGRSVTVMAGGRYLARDRAAPRG